MRARPPIHSLLAVAALVACGGCAFLERTEEDAAVAPDSLDVVDERGPFEPSQAVDDDDEAGVATALGVGDEEAIDREEFAPPAARAEPEAKPAEAQDLPDGESIAGEEEVARIEGERKAAHDAAAATGGDDRAKKVALSANPPPEDPGSGEPAASTLLDTLLELAIVVVAAALVALAWTGLRHLPRPVLAAGALACAAAIGWFALSLA